MIGRYERITECDWTKKPYPRQLLAHPRLVVHLDELRVDDVGAEDVGELGGDGGSQLRGALTRGGILPERVIFRTRGGARNLFTPPRVRAPQLVRVFFFLLFSFFFF